MGQVFLPLRYALSSFFWSPSIFLAFSTLSSTAPSARQIYPSYVTDGLREALEAFDARMPGFVCDEALLHGVETRTSSPVQVQRVSLPNEEIESFARALIVHVGPCP